MTLRDRSRRLRLEETDAERHLWARLRDRQIAGAKFRRQHPIGPFIADFCCPERGLVVELDGGQHASQQEADARRSEYLRGHGYRVLRFWDHEVLREPDAVLARIAEALEDAPAGELDIRDEVCPYTFLKAKLALEPMAPGQVLRVLVGNETSARDVPRGLADAGHGVLAVESTGGGLWAITVRKRPSAP